MADNAPKSQYELTIQKRRKLSPLKRDRQNARRRLYNKAQKASLKALARRAALEELEPLVKAANAAVSANAANAAGGDTAPAKGSGRGAAAKVAPQVNEIPPESIVTDEKTGRKYYVDPQTKQRIRLLPPLQALQRKLDKLAAKGVLHRNTVARRKSRLAKRVNRLKAVAATKPASSSPASP